MKCEIGPSLFLRFEKRLLSLDLKPKNNLLIYLRFDSFMDMNFEIDNGYWFPEIRGKVVVVLIWDLYQHEFPMVNSHTLKI